MAETVVSVDEQRYEHVVGLQLVSQPHDVREWLADSVIDGNLSLEEPKAFITDVPRDLELFDARRSRTLASMLKAGARLGLESSVARFGSGGAMSDFSAPNSSRRASGALQVALGVPSIGLIAWLRGRAPLARRWFASYIPPGREE
jgi:hypothetical protein